MSLERVYSIDWLRVICKGSKGLIYLLPLTWLQWFTRTSKLKVRTAEVLPEIILANAGTALVLYSLVLMVVELARTSCQYQREAESDPLTGLYNRRAFFAAADCVLKEASAGRRSPVLAILDLDNMKEINDTWGHQCGDEALKQAARSHPEKRPRGGRGSPLRG